MQMKKSKLSHHNAFLCVQLCTCNKFQPDWSIFQQTPTAGGCGARVAGKISGARTYFVPRIELRMSTEFQPDWSIFQQTPTAGGVRGPRGWVDQWGPYLFRSPYRTTY